jgi:hypothetical protein
LSRVWQHVKSNRPFAIITAFRRGYDFQTNNKRNRVLAAKIGNAGYGYFFMEGHWIESEETSGAEEKVKEDSVFVVGRESDFDKEGEKRMKNLMVNLAQKFNQDGFIMKMSDPKGIHIFDKNGNIFKTMSTLNPSSLSQSYQLLSKGAETGGKEGIEGFTKLRNRGERSFYFESIREDVGFIGHLAGAHRIKRTD